MESQASHKLPCWATEGPSYLDGKYPSFGYLWENNKQIVYEREGEGGGRKRERERDICS